MCSDKKACASFCAVYSVIGSLFMLMVVMMLTYQPLIVGGINDLGIAKANAYGALFTFAVSFGLSIFYLVQHSILGGASDRRQRRRNEEEYEYSDVPTNSNILQERNSLNLDLPRSVQEGVFS